MMNMWKFIVSHFPGWDVILQAVMLLVLPVVFYFLSHWVKSRLSNRSSAKSRGASTSGAVSNSDDEEFAGEQPVTGNYDHDLSVLKQQSANHCDIHIREFILREKNKAALLYVDGLYDKNLMDTQVLESLMTQCGDGDHVPITKENLLNQILSISQVSDTGQLNQVIQNILTGSVALVVEGVEEVVFINGSAGNSRAIEEPVSEGLLRGPRTGFTETLSENTALLRRHGRNESLQMTKFKVGARAQKDLIIAYMRDIANPELVNEVIRRIEAIDMDYLAESGYVEQLIEDNNLSLFQQVQSTERPDRVIGALMEGRVAILLDGTPFVLIVPVTFSMLLQSPEDYYERWIPASLLRILRFFTAFLAVFTPALYISFISFNQGLIPTELVVTIIESRLSVPFPSIIEALLMEISIEILREAGIRLPKPIGPAMGIVGGLIIGDAAVNAGIISPFLVIVVAVTAISSFAIPSYSAGITLRMLRFLAMFFAAFLGLFGTVMFFILVCSHLAKLKSFGVAYISPLSPYRWNDWKDFIVRMPFKLMNRRPILMKTKDSSRRNK